MKQLLIIEDEYPVRAFLKKMLAFSGYSTYSAENGSQGVQIAQTLQPDLIICDLVLPKMNGFSVLTIIRAMNNLRPIPFIFLTSNSDKSALRTGMKLGADCYLTKPIDRTALLSAIDARLASVDRLDVPVANMPQFLGKPSSMYVSELFNNSEFAKRYNGWFMAIESHSGKCFLGPDKKSALEQAQQVFPDDVFFFRQVQSSDTPATQFA